MNRKILWAVVAGALVCSGCILDSKDDYVYKVSTSDNTEVMITTEGFGQQQVLSPWESQTFERADGAWIYLAARRWAGVYGSVTVSVTKNGKVWLTETSNGEFVVASVSGSAH